MVTILTILTVGGYSGAEQTLRPVPRQRVPNGLLYRRVQVRIVDSKANAIDFNFYSGCYFTFIMIENICQNAQNKCYFYNDLVLWESQGHPIFLCGKFIFCRQNSSPGPSKVKTSNTILLIFRFNRNNFISFEFLLMKQQL